MSTSSEHYVIASGRTAEILMYDHNRVLKLFRAGFPASVVEEEFEISAAVHGSGVAAPKPYPWIEYNGRQGIPFIIVR